MTASGFWNESESWGLDFSEELKRECGSFSDSSVLYQWFVAEESGKALEIAPNHIYALWILAASYFLYSMHDKAMKEFQKVVKLFDRIPYTWPV